MKLQSTKKNVLLSLAACGPPAGFFVEGTMQTVAQVFAYSLWTADVDGDGREDIVVGQDGGFSIYYNNVGDGGEGVTFASSYVRNTNQQRSGNVLRVAMGDFDGDGRLDVVTGTQYDYRAEANVYLHRNLGSRGSFQITAVNEKKLWEDDDIAGLESVDLDSDGDMDLVVLIDKEAGWKQLCQFVNDGAGVFEKTILSVNVGDTACCLNIGDFDGDGSPDISVRDGSTLVVFWNRYLDPAPITPASTGEALSIKVDGDWINNFNTAAGSGSYFPFDEAEWGMVFGAPVQDNKIFRVEQWREGVVVWTGNVIVFKKKSDGYSAQGRREPLEMGVFEEGDELRASSSSTPEGPPPEYTEERFDNFDSTANLVVPDWNGTGRTALVSNSGYYLHSNSNAFVFTSYGRGLTIPGNVHSDLVVHYFFDSDTRDSIMSYDLADVLYRSFYIDGTVATQQLYTMSRKTIKRAFADIDGDGITDIVVHARGGGTTSGQYKLVSWISGADNFAEPSILTLPPTDSPTLPPPTLSPSRSSPPTFGGTCLGGTSTKRCSSIFRSQSCNACYVSCSYIASDCELGCGAVTGCRCSASIQPCILGTGTNRVSCSGTTTVDCSTFTNQKTCAAESDCYWQPNEVPVATTTATTASSATSTVVIPTPALKYPESLGPSSAPNIPIRTTLFPSLIPSDDSPLDESSTDIFLPTYQPSEATYMPTAAQDTPNARIEESSSNNSSLGYHATNSCDRWFVCFIWILLSTGIYFM